MDKTCFPLFLGKYRLDTLKQSLNGFDQVRKRGEVNRRASHFSQVDVAEELENGQVGNRRVFVARAVEDVIQDFDNLLTIRKRGKRSGSIKTGRWNSLYTCG